MRTKDKSRLAVMAELTGSLASIATIIYVIVRLVG
jgi:uncharacterized membrane protein YuzA (DUF378 family)